MKLLIFAHRGEASYFFMKKKYRLAGINNLYISNDTYLLITGEGFSNINKRLNALLTSTKFKITEVVNLGIAGALDLNLQLGSIHNIRYAYGEGKKERYISKNDKAQIDCISAKHRVLNKEYTKILSIKAPIVDRELWAIAHFCHNFTIPFNSIKLISDIAGENIPLENIIKKSKEFSKNLYDYFSSER